MSVSSENSESNDLYVIEEIRAKKFKKNVPYYLIKWEGYSDSECTWEPKESIHCLDYLREFELKWEKIHKSKKKAKPIENENTQNKTQSNLIDHKPKNKISDEISTTVTKNTGKITDFLKKHTKFTDNLNNDNEPFKVVENNPKEIISLSLNYENKLDEFLIVFENNEKKWIKKAELKSNYKDLYYDLIINYFESRLKFLGKGGK